MQLLNVIALVGAASCGTQRMPGFDAGPGFSSVELDAGPQGERFDSGNFPDGPGIQYDALQFGDAL